MAIRVCEICSNKLNRGKRFCSRTCSMSSPDVRSKIFKGLHSDESKRKQKAALKTTEYREKRKGIALVLGSKTVVKERARKTMYELHEKMRESGYYKNGNRDRCIRLIREGKFGGGLPHSKPSSKGLLSGKPALHKRTGILMRSTWEVSFANLCDVKKLEWKYEDKIFDFGWTRYLPDFFVNNYVIDVKPLRRFELDKKVKIRFQKIKKEFKKLGVNFLLVDKKDFSKTVNILQGVGY